jgi:hypothetical protein
MRVNARNGLLWRGGWWHRRKGGFIPKVRETLMQDAMNLLMLVCASVAAMAFGVLAAYGICRAAFAALRIHARSVAGTAISVQRSAVGVQK